MVADNLSDLPEKFVRTISGMFGAAGEKWLADLPAIVSNVASEWALTMHEPFPSLSYHYVAPCIRIDGVEAVLKIGFPGEELEFFSEVRALSLYDGEGTVRLFDVDNERFAMLLEKVSPGESLGRLCLEDDDRGVKIAAEILKKMIRNVPEDANFHLLENWINGFDRAEHTAFPQQAIERSRVFYQELSGKNEQKFLLHGDFHHENILSARRKPYLVIDPKGLVGGVGYDVAVFLNNHRNWLEGESDIDAKLASAVDNFVGLCGLTSEDIRKWAYLQMVLSAWWTFEENDERWLEELSKAEIWQV